MTQHLAAIDLGATSGRVMVGTLTSGPTPRLLLEQAARFPNSPIENDTGLHWDLPTLLDEIRTGLNQAARQYPLASVGIDSWAVDYSLLTPTGPSLPFHYRDERTHRGVALVHERVGFPELYRRTGLQFLPFNTLYQLASEAPEHLSKAERLLLIPDLIAYLLTGAERTEYTNASTTGLRSVDGSWDTELMDILAIPQHLFPPLIHPGQRIGITNDPAVPQGLPVIAVGSHDTASAVVAVPMDPSSAAYISCGTWALVGVETQIPITTDQSREANFTNEAGVDGRNRFLHNIMGLWLLDESVKKWNASRPSGLPLEIRSLLQEASYLKVTADQWIFDVNDPVFMPRGDMPARIQQWFTDRGLPHPRTPAEITRSIIESLAHSFARTVETAGSLSGTAIKTIHMVGGGSLNTLLCQRTADISGRPVLAGPVEATAIGNLLIQARSHGWIGDSLEAVRHVVSTSFVPRTFHPSSDQTALP